MTIANQATIGWSATIGLFEDYGHGNAGDVEARRRMLVDAWMESMTRTRTETGLSISAVMGDSRVLYPHNSCPDGGEMAVTLTGSCNPEHVAPAEHESFMAAVQTTVRRVQEVMGQKTVRIEFHRIDRLVYSKLAA